MKRAVIVAASIIFVVGCNGIHKTKTKNTQYSQEIITKHCELSPFSSLVLAGDAKVELVNGSYAIDVTGIGADRYNCQNSAVDKILHVNKNMPGTLMRVSVPELRNITLNGNAIVSSRDFKTSKLTIIAKDYSTVNLEGQFNIDKIFQLSRGRINVSWINSNKLLIGGYDSGPICLAGVADNMVVKLVKDASLNARYLRTQKTSVITADRARAEILALDTLSAFAVDTSSIFYYKKPKNLTVVTRDSGNALQLDSTQ